MPHKDPEKRRASMRAASKRWRAKNPEKHRAIVKRANRKRKGWTPAMGEPETCAICAVKLTDTIACMDHDHTTGVGRGWLCRSCNLVLGHAHDDPAVLRSAAIYVEAA